MSGSPNGLKRVFIKTYGCQMNVYDSERMADALAPSGYVPAGTAEEADLILLNTCHIREKAAEKVYSDLGRLKRLKEAGRRDGRQVMVGVAGCVAQAEGEEIIRRAPLVDLVVGPQAYQRLPAIVAAAAAGARVVETEFAVEEKFAALEEWATRDDHSDTPPLRGGERAFSLSEAKLGLGKRGEGVPRSPEWHQDPHPSRPGLRPAQADLSPPGRGVRAQNRSAGARVAAFLTVQEGCDKFCTFCVVPYTRGAEISRPARAIIAEAERLAAEGVREVTLLGQNVNAWRDAGWGLGQLLFRLAEIPGLDRLRYTTSHPRDMDDELIAAHRDLDALMPYLHLPVQSGSDRVLAAMNRRHSRADYLAIIDRVRRARSDIALAGDFIVGFPGETDRDFADTLAIIEEVGYASAFSFKYSPRPGTPAAAAGDQVPEAVKSERLAALQAMIAARQAAFSRSRVGTLTEVLFERRGRYAGQVVGRSPWLLPVQVEAGEDRIGTIARVEVVAVSANSLFGRLAEPRDGAARRHAEAAA